MPASLVPAPSAFALWLTITPVFDVVGIGANSVDYVYRVPAAPDFHGRHSKLRLTGHSISCGGQVATAMATCASLGLHAAYAGAVGTDDNGRRVEAALADRGVDLSLIVRKTGGNQFAAILIEDDSGERVVLWDRPDSLLLSDADLPATHCAVPAPSWWTTSIRGQASRRRGWRARPAFRSSPIWIT